ncbi:hypothetical protein D0T84_00940 [Dysgonomonas sp. 521]|uniref:hypothetical protein n=1 Tax=Dysgonomonas sp. 521 TaxID=2302932 RepID=UPI0013D2477E|nr:hypothetical protein [Dysgonomonas sp. 521]NDV93484.1 hypothetical protein [Dysgonomonas sp. 521]
METIKNLQELSELRQRIEILESKILKPQLTDLQHIPLLYNWFEVIANEIQDFPGKDNTEYRQVFLYCILILYCPRALADDFLIRGLRQSLAILFGLSPSHISNLMKNLTFYYEKYTKFRGNCDVVLAEMQFKVEMEGLK